MLDSIKGLFSGKKSQDDGATANTKKSKGYFLELDDTGSVKSETDSKKPESGKAKAKAKAKAPETQEAQPPAPTVAKDESTKAQPVKEVPSGKQTVKVEAQPNPPVTAASNGKVESQESTFAPKYLMPTANNSRRRPGPSMDMFRDMARQVNPRK